MSKVTTGDIKREVGVTNLDVSSLQGGRSFPIRYGKVTRVDPKKMVVDISTLGQGSNVDFKNVAITFPGAGARHFFGAMPEVGDICLIGQQPAESGRSKRPVILGWYVPSTQAGYDWLNVRSHGPDELDLTPKQKVALEGLASERRHKLRQMEAGNIVASSSQGSDLLLTESATLTNRRGNELVLRDQDQALVVRSLQQFHAGAGFRSYSGMVQRDASLLPLQVAQDRVDWASTRQVDEARQPLPPESLDPAEQGAPHFAAVFDTDLITTQTTNPYDILRRGLFIDMNGNLTTGQADRTTYGGKSMYRVATDLSDAGSVSGTPTFTEYRVEVSHTSTGVLPVTEQTDGVDVDRLLSTTPSTDPDFTGGATGGVTDPTLLSPNAPMVEFVLGTVVGNDPFGRPTEYGLPLVAKVTTESGQPQTALRPFDPQVDTLQDQIAFMIRSRDPEDPTKESFLALSKGGAWLTSFQGQGSKVNQENLRTGKFSYYGSDSDNMSRVIQAGGAVSISASTGRTVDNVGVEIRSASGAVVIYGGGPNSTGAASGAPSSPSNSKVALSLQSAASTSIEAAEQIKVSAPDVSLTDAKTINLTASSSVNINAGDTVSLSAKSLGVTINGSAEYLFGGPLNALATNGASRITKFTATPLTGAVGGVVDEYTVVFGNVADTIRVGRHEEIINVGSYNVGTMTVNLPSLGPGAGFDIYTGLPLLSNGISGTPASLTVKANVGPLTLLATKGPVSVTGTAGVFMSSTAKVQIAAPYVNVLAPLSPFGGVLTDGCLDSVTGRPFLLSGTLGAPTFRVGP